MAQCAADGIAVDQAHGHIAVRRAGGDGRNRLESTRGGHGGASGRAGIDRLGKRVSGSVSTHNGEADSSIAAARCAGQRQLLCRAQTQVGPKKGQGTSSCGRLHRRQCIGTRDDTDLERTFLSLHRTDRHVRRVVDQNGGRAIACSFVVGRDHAATQRHGRAAAVHTNLACASVDRGAGVPLRHSNACQRNVSATGTHRCVRAQCQLPAARLQTNVTTPSSQTPVDADRPVGCLDIDHARGATHHHIRVQRDVFVARLRIGRAGRAQAKARAVVVLVVVVSAEVDMPGVVLRRQACCRDAVVDREARGRLHIDVAELRRWAGAVATQERAGADGTTACATEGQVVSLTGVAVDKVPEADGPRPALERDRIIQVKVTGAHGDRAVAGLGVDGDGAAAVGHIVVTQPNLTT